MAGKKSNVKSVNSSKKKSNKPLHYNWLYPEVDIEKLKQVFIEKASPHYAGLLTNTSIQIIESLKTIISKTNELIKLSEVVDRKHNSSSLSSPTYLLKEFSARVEVNRKTISRPKFTSKRSIGRPQVNGRMAFVLLSAIERSLGDRKKIDQIGHLIKQQGELSRLINLKYGPNYFDRLNFPTVNFVEGERWDANVTSQLRSAVKKYLKIDTRTSRDIEKDLAKKIKGAYKHGLTPYEIAAMEEIDQSFS